MRDVRPVPAYDFDNQAWTLDGKYIRCGHPDSMDCRCFGKIHEGEDAPSATDLIQRYANTR